MKPEVKGDIAKARHKELTEIVNAKNYAFRRDHRNELEVLLESGKDGIFHGFDQYYNKVTVTSEDDLSSNWVLLNDVEVSSEGNTSAL